MKDYEDIYKMYLGQVDDSPDGLWMITRVPGGWIFTTYLPSSSDRSSVFVPFVVEKTE